MLLYLTAEHIGDERIDCFAESDICSFGQDGVRTDSFHSMGGDLQKSHLERREPDELFLHQSWGRIAAQNALTAVSDEDGFEFFGGIFAFDFEEGTQSWKPVRFFPDISTIDELPTFRRNLSYLEEHKKPWGLRDVDIQEIRNQASRDRLKGGLCIPGKLFSTGQTVDAFLELRIHAGAAMIGELHIFADPEVLGETGELIQIDHLTDQVVTIGTVENLFVPIAEANRPSAQ